VRGPLSETRTRWLREGPPRPPRGAPPGQGGGGAGDAEVAERATREPAETGPRLVCDACGWEITDLDAKMAVHGRHDHRCVNPHGRIFDIGCFARASGAEAVGAPSAFFSWFEGFTWRIARCRGCGVHLGWRFEGLGAARDAFWGLILTRLREAPGPVGPPSP